MGEILNGSTVSPKGCPIRVLIVDDSAFICHTLARRLEADLDIAVVGKVHDGLAALRCIRAERPTLVVMLSAYTRRGTRATTQALIRGAVDFVPKPAIRAELDNVIEELIVKVKIAAGTPISTRLPSAPLLRSYSPTPRTSVSTTHGAPAAYSLWAAPKLCLEPPIWSLKRRVFPFTAATIRDDGLSKSEACITGVVR